MQSNSKNEEAVKQKLEVLNFSTLCLQILLLFYNIFPAQKTIIKEIKDHFYYF